MSGPLHLVIPEAGSTFETAVKSKNMGKTEEARAKKADLAGAKRFSVTLSREDAKKIGDTVQEIGTYIVAIDLGIPQFAGTPAQINQQLVTHNSSNSEDTRNRAMQTVHRINKAIENIKLAPHFLGPASGDGMTGIVSVAGTKAGATALKQVAGVTGVSVWQGKDI